jgi:TonB-linked SusC/RagA family outer membrane protein
MKLLSILLLVASMQLAARTNGQTITLKIRNAPVQVLFKEIQKQTGLNVMVDESLLDKVGKITLDVKNMPVAEVLNICFKPGTLTYSIADDRIVIKATPVRVPQPSENAPPKTAAPVIVIRGRVVNEKNVPLSGANVQLKGTSNGTRTNSEGEFQLNIEKKGTLVISYVGYATREVNADTLDYIQIILQEAQSELNTVVVVGYGSQKKIDLTGAVDQVGSEYFEDRPLPNVTKGLQGVLPNLNIKITDGKPTRGAAYNIRGSTSIGAGAVPNALVLIDGVTGDPQNLNPGDIESVTILKDAASAAIYGSRAAFGVVLITTKTPKSGKTQISYSTSFSNNRRTTTPDLVTDGYTWAKNYDEALYAWMDYGTHPVNIDGKLLFSAAYLDSLKKRSEDPTLPNWGIDASGNYAYYASTDWMKELYKNSNNSTEHALNISGGNDRIKLAFSGRYFFQDGIFRYNADKYNRYNFRVKGEIKVSEKFFVHANVDYTNTNYKYPLTSQGGVNSLWRLLAASGYPLAPLLNPDGTLTNIASYSIGDFYQQKSFSQLKENINRSTIGFRALPFQHITVKGDFTFINMVSTDQRRYFPVTYSIKPGVLTNSGLNYLEDYDQTERNLISNLYAEYSNRFKDHSLTVLVGGNQESYSFRNKRTRRDGLIVDNIVDWNLATGTNYVLTGGGNEWATAGLFGRINYAYKNKYLFEVNGRYDGSSRFPENRAWGFFPSVEAGWIISKEKFLESTAGWLNLLKIRGSYGSLGNGNIAPYSFVPTIGVSTSTVLQNGVYPNYIQRPNVFPNDITWERVNMANIGLDLSFLRNRFTVTADAYERNTIGMITVGPPLPAVFGAVVPNGNNANLRTRGWELSLNWQDKIGSKKPVSYSLRVTLSDYTSVVTKFYNPDKLLNTYYEGYELGTIWGFQTLGFFKDAADITNSPNQKNYFQVSNGNNILPGDLKFADLNKDNFVNIGKNTLADPGDRRVIGNTTPRLPYSVTGTVSWENFSLFAFVQGVMKRDWMPSPEAAYFWGQYNRPYSVMPTFNQNRWTEANPDPNAYFPRYRAFVALSGTRELAIAQTRYLQNASYVRLKTLTLSYSLPATVVKKISAQSIRIYFSGQNLWTYSPMFKITKNFDPEVIEGSDPEVNAGGGDGFSYPMEKTYSVGININF